jgi:serine/threonine-protein kinase
MAVNHPHLAKTVDAGFVGSDVFAVVEPPAGEALEALVKDIGPMPTFLAAEFAKQTAQALQAIHNQGLTHGDVRPAHIVVGPLAETPRQRDDGSTVMRPASDAKAILTDFGMIPARPGGREWAALDPLSAKPLGFLAPERVASGAATPASDLHGLGATLFFLLTGRAPYVANSAEGVVNAIENTPPAPLATLRPDLPVGLVDLVNRLIARNPADRPASATEVAAALASFTEPEPVALTAAPEEIPPIEWTANAFTGSHLSDPRYAPAAEDHRAAFESAHSEAAAQPREPKKKAPMTEAERAKLKMWLYLGGFFWFIMVPLLWLVLLSDSGCFRSKEKSTPTKPDSSNRRPKAK